MAVEENPNALVCGGCGGSGDCFLCKGTGILNSFECRKCGGTGICPGCKGSGWIVIPLVIVHESPKKKKHKTETED